jgi:hypothetical protein
MDGLDHRLIGVVERRVDWVSVGSDSAPHRCERKVCIRRKHQLSHWRLLVAVARLAWVTRDCSAGMVDRDEPLPPLPLP